MVFCGVTARNMISDVARNFFGEGEELMELYLYSSYMLSSHGQGKLHLYLYSCLSPKRVNPELHYWSIQTFLALSNES